MKIDNYVVSMESRHQLKASYTRSETINSWQDSKTVQDSKLPDGSTGLTGIRQWLQDQLTISEQAKEALQREAQETVKNPVEPLNLEDLPDLSDEDKRKIYILESMLSALLGRKIKFRIPRPIQTEAPDRTAVETRDKMAGLKIPAGNGRPAQVRQGWGLIYERNESYRESEKLSFSSSGIIRTREGQEIQFQVELQMNREFAASNHISARAGDALLDPLVINYNGPAAQLSSTKYSFDLDADGNEDQISFIKDGSGFLALDLNDDGIINNGKELFGPATGNGFTELAGYDQDQNGWIDENDPVFDKLRIWTKDAEGKDVLFGLGQKGIGAIFLGNIQAQFGLKDSQNQLLGQAQNAGIFIKENGSVGTVQQVDLVV